MRIFVMAGLDPAIHVFLADVKRGVDARVKPGHDEREREDPLKPLFLPTKRR